MVPPLITDIANGGGRKEEVHPIHSSPGPADVLPSNKTRTIFSEFQRNVPRGGGMRSVFKGHLEYSP